MKVAVIGSTGVVGNVMLSLLESRNFPLSDLIPVASERSIGKKILFKEKYYNIVSIEDAKNETRYSIIFCRWINIFRMGSEIC
jgi:aspartate-semialdehyde dehydrogenase